MKLYDNHFCCIEVNPGYLEAGQNDCLIWHSQFLRCELLVINRFFFAAEVIANANNELEEHEIYSQLELFCLLSKIL